MLLLLLLQELRQVEEEEQSSSEEEDEAGEGKGQSGGSAAGGEAEAHLRKARAHMRSGKVGQREHGPQQRIRAAGAAVPGGARCGHCVCRAKGRRCFAGTWCHSLLTMAQLRACCQLACVRPSHTV